MEAGELRIGNYYRYGETSEICLEGDDMVYYFEGGSDSFNPIPLTEEWLLKFGFEFEYKDHYGGYKYYKKKDFTSLADYGSQCFAIPIKKKDQWGNETYPHIVCGYYANEIDCEYVHSLQNLYFALTGEELTIK